MYSSALIAGLGLDTGRAYRKDTSGPNAFGSDAFMQLMLAQLRNQNPMDPVQDKEFMGQLTQMNSLQELQKMTSLMQGLVKSNGLSDAAALIGKTVDAHLADGTTQTGVVSGVTMHGADAVVHLGATTVPFTSIISVRA
jgi:flagellar basal-body rod modification protein FlgD